MALAIADRKHRFQDWVGAGMVKERCEESFGAVLYSRAVQEGCGQLRIDPRENDGLEL